MTGCVLVGTAASVYCPSLSAEKQKDNSFPGSPVLHKIKAADEEDKDYSEAAGCSLSGRAPCPCLLRHSTPTQRQRDRHTNLQTHTHTVGSHVQWRPPYSSDEEGCSAYYPALPAPTHPNTKPIRNVPSGQLVRFLSLSMNIKGFDTRSQILMQVPEGPVRIQCSLRSTV